MAGVIKGKDLRRKELLALVKKHFPGKETAASYDHRAGFYYLKDYILHIFVSYKKVKHKIFGIFTKTSRVPAETVIVEPNDRAYPRREIWEDYWRPVKIHIVHNNTELRGRCVRFASGYEELTRTEATISLE